MLQNAVRNANGVEDMVNLNYLHEPAILYNLKQRFLRQIPYTYTGPICIAVNPVRTPLSSQKNLLACLFADLLHKHTQSDSHKHLLACC